MPAARERKCCKEFPAVISLQPVGCLTENKYFENVWLNRIVLRTVYTHACYLWERVNRPQYRNVNLLMPTYRIFCRLFCWPYQPISLCSIFVELFLLAVQALDSWMLRVIIVARCFQLSILKNFDGSLAESGEVRCLVFTWRNLIFIGASSVCIRYKCTLFSTCSRAVVTVIHSDLLSTEMFKTNDGIIIFSSCTFWRYCAGAKLQSKYQ